MDQIDATPTPPTARVNPVQDPQILPISYSMPIWPTRFSSPTAAACVPSSFIDLFLRKK